ncbi:MAG: hypothetical protein FWD47_08180 [Treponema sp.]|nr:hypothetical protein [Treponema sp.]
MKKIVLLIAGLCVLTGFVFAQSYTVQSVTGRVQRESGNTLIDVRVGDILTNDTVIQTGVGASLVLAEGERTFTISAARSGTIGELAAAASGIRINGNITRADTGSTTRAAGQVSTASARASDAAEDDDIAAE